ncbi:MAG TPA: hypothetical protein VGS28_03440 [Candidatus Saccharimonadales bacterium]|nr:hypothetical protein [Candidatus Saccharimonadales bacterium]
MSYRKEAQIRVTYLAGATVASLIVAVIVGAIIARIFSHTNQQWHDRIFFYSATAVFALVCSPLVYKIDQKLNKRFSGNP